MLTLSAAQVTKHNVTLYGAGKSVRVILFYYSISHSVTVLNLRVI